jgi:7-hydroxymethyl chlorophyll a reductase
MEQHTQYLTVRNARGREMLDALRNAGGTTSPPVSTGTRAPIVMETVLTDDAAALGRARKPAPLWAGHALAWLLTAVGPRGLEFARFSIDYHTLRNIIYVREFLGRRCRKY